jgi:hypothetical protein
MTYAPAERPFYDADSHIMELPNFLIDYADPGVRGACVELGAGWVPAMLTRLDWVVRSWSKVDQYLAELQRTPSETLRAQMGFTPYVFEDIGSLTDQSYDDIYLFSSDYPHVEGGRDPIGRFETFLGSRAGAVRENFYAENFLKIFPGARVHDKVSV